ncbi:MULTISPECIES: ATP-binding protein [unclassified Spirosoma]|uniref:hybrid sensor histidine kinase/response regulator transcription factor n=1 Tax=unclassified Spirosoma TaxID=2621999 RepID=UPI00095CE680|nr:MULTISPECIES: ATP-binding protein [unclassified Spirosoma]MBN8822509.1 response regulator [Spirosoma sp.]OJW74014.1 MAG: hypothetical protein BGO59_12810 [Spirosoma sp. 48-14]
MNWRYTFIGLLVLSTSLVTAQQKPVDSLRYVLRLAQHDSIRAKILPALVNSYEEIDNDSALFFGKQYLHIAQKLRQPALKADALKQLGYVYMNQGNYAESLRHLFKSLAITREIGPEPTLIDIYRSIGYLYFLYGDYAKAKEYLLIAKRFPHQQIPQYIYAHLANAYEELNQIDSAYWYIKRGYHTAITHNRQLHLGYMMASMASVYAKLGKTDSAIALYRTSLAVCRRQKNFRTFSHNAVKLAQLYYNRGQLDSSLIFARQSIRSAGKVRFPLDTWEASTLLARIYKARYNPDSAFYYQEIQLATQNMLFNRQKIQQTQLVAFEEQQRQQKAVAEQTAYQNRVRQYGLLAGLAVLALIGSILLRTNFQKQQINAQLQRQARQLQETLIELKASQLREAEQAKAADEMKMRFFANITHEFRTPLSLIAAPVEKLLGETALTSPYRYALTTIQRNTQKLLHLINQLLDIARLEAGTMPVVDVQGNLVDFVVGVAEQFRPMAEKKAISMIYEVENDQYQWLFDADKWEKILSNLLSNALKFTPPGGNVRLSFRIAPTGAAYMATIQLTDSGIGILPARLPHIFDRFYQADDSHTRSHEGTGIGLSLVKELVGLLGGSVSVSSLPGNTVFTVELGVRLATGDYVAPAIVPTSCSLPDLVSVAEAVGIAETITGDLPLVLVVEDNAELRSFLVEELQTTFRILTAVNGEEGWEVTQRELPDVVISDIMMPLMDGYELTQRIKTTPETDHIGVVLLTAKADNSSKLDGLVQGSDDYITKPFALTELRLRLRNLLSHQQKLREHYQQQMALPATGNPVELIQDKFLLRVYELLDNHLDNSELSVEWIAGQLAMNRKTLYRKIQSLTQLAPNELIRRYRLRKAAELLQTGYNVSEAAYRVGFETPNYFSQCFKEIYQLTPSEFINQTVLGAKMRVMPHN